MSIASLKNLIRNLTSKQAPRRADSVRLGVETLENRELMATGITASLASGVLRVEGTNQADTIRVVQHDGVLQVIGDSGSAHLDRSFSAAKVKEIKIDGKKGNDSIDLGGAAVAKVQIKANGLTTSLSQGVLKVTGTDKADTIRLRQSDAFVQAFADIGGAHLSEIFPVAMLQEIKVDGQNGDDTIDLGGGAGDAVHMRATLVGGKGKDRLIGGVGANQFQGNDNGDQIVFAGDSNSIQAGNRNLTVSNGGLYLGNPGGNSGTPTEILATVQSLITLGNGKVAVEFGGYFKTTISVASGTAGSVNLTFSNVQFNLAKLLHDSQGNLNSAIRPLAELAHRLTDRWDILPSWAVDKLGLNNLSPLQMLRLAGYNTQADLIQRFAATINAIQDLSSRLSADGWVTVVNGSITARAAVDDALPRFVSGAMNAVDGIFQQVGVDVAALRSLGINLGLPAFAQADQFFNVLIGKPVDLVTVNIADWSVAGFEFDRPLADFPTPIPGSDVQIGLYASASFSAGATIVFNSAGLRSGNMASGFSVRDKHLAADFSVGVSGTYWQYYLVGYRVTGAFEFHAQDFNAPAPTHNLNSNFVTPFGSDRDFADFLKRVGKVLNPNDAPGAPDNAPGKLLANVGGTAQVLRGMGATFPEVVQVLVRIGANPANVASALFYRLGRNSFEVATDLLSGGYSIYDTARGLLNGAGRNSFQVASDLYHGAHLDIYDTARALHSGINRDSWGVAADLFRGAGLTIYETAKALHSGINRDSFGVASDLFNGAGLTIYDTAKALYYGINRDSFGVAADLFNGAGRNVYDVARALFFGAGLNLNFTQTASAIYNGVGDLTWFDALGIVDAIN